MSVKAFRHIEKLNKIQENEFLKMDYSRFSSIKVILKDIFKTKVISGSYLKYNLLKILFFIGEAFQFFEKIGRYIKNNISRSEFIINNEYGIFKVNSYDDTLKHSNYYSEYFLRKWYSFLKNKSGYFLDIGSNIGGYSIFVGNRFKNIKVIAFEPNPYVYNINKENIRLNNLSKKITLENIGISNKKDKLTFKKYHNRTGLSQFTSNDKLVKENKHYELLTLDVIDLESYFKHKQIPLEKVKLIKIDVEGLEFEVLKGSLSLLKNMVLGTKLIVEISGDYNHKKKIFTFLERFDLHRKKGICNNYLFEKTE